MQAEKTCSMCHRTLPITEFYTQRTESGTLIFRSRCKSCYRGVIRNYYWTHRDKVLERQRQQYEKRRPRLLNYYRTHRKERLQYQLEWYRKRHHITKQGENTQVSVHPREHNERR